MKRFWSVAAVVLALVACSAFMARAGDSGSMSSDAKSSDAKSSDTKSSDTKSSETKSSTSKSAMKGDAALQAKLEALERSTWEAFKSKDAKAAMANISPDSWSADMNGFAPASQIESMMQDMALNSYELSDFKVLHLGKDAVVLTYSATSNCTYKGQAVPAGPYFCSTAYVSKGGKWTGMYHQETLAMSATPSAGMEQTTK